MRFYDYWVCDEKYNGIVQLMLADSVDMDATGRKIVSVHRTSLRELEGSSYGVTLEEAVNKIAARFDQVAAALRAFAPQAQAVMDSPDATMTAQERTISENISRLVREAAWAAQNGTPGSFNAEALHALASDIANGKWKEPR